MTDQQKLKVSSPVFSWSPLPPRRKLDFVNNKQQNTERTKECSKENAYYPNCEFNVWLRSCETEIVEPLQGEIKGTIPVWLNGSLLRNGPGSLKAGQDEFQHLFDCSALLHRFNINNGNVTYQCRFLQSEIYKRIWSANRLVMTEFGTKAVPDPCHTIFQRIATIFDFKANMSDNAMISLYPFGDEVYAFNEIPFIHRIDVETLETLHRVDVSKHLSIVNHTSHPHVMEDSSVYNVGLTLYATGPHYSIVHFPKRLDADNSSMFENASIVASIPVRWPLHPSYMHTFGITTNYFIIVEQPLSISMPSMVALKLQNEPLAGALRWFGNEYTQINIICRKNGSIVRRYQAETFFFLHIINQYEDSNHVVIDICAYRDPSMLDCMYIETMKNMQSDPDYAKMFRGRPIRFVLPLEPESPESAGVDVNLVTLSDSGAVAKYLPNGELFVSAELLCRMGCETPRIDYERFSGRKYRYFYAISSDVDAINPGTIIKVDTKSRTAHTWQEPWCFPGEPIFVPTPDGRAEDDGVLLSVVVWGKNDTNRVALLVLDAHDLKEIARAEFRTPSPVPKCLHGWFFPQRKHLPS